MFLSERIEKQEGINTNDLHNRYMYSVFNYLWYMGTTLPSEKA